MKNITEANITPKTRVFVRVDMDVPFEKDVVKDTSRLDKALETLNYIIEKGGIPIIAGHMGRPKGEINQELSTNRILPYLNEKLGENNFELLENLRFNAGEKNNDEAFVKELADRADIYVNESFATSHREHASIVGIPKILPAYAGFRLQKEVSTLSKIIEKPQRPLTLIAGGAKIESKKPLIDAFLDKADKILVGGRLGLEWKEPLPKNVFIPEDYARDNFDIGPKTTEKYVDILSGAKTVIWAGPLGMFEEDEFFKATFLVAKKVADLTESNGCFSLIGGGDTVAAIKKAQLVNKMSFISTGGSAMLEYLAKGTLPGIEALN